RPEGGHLRRARRGPPLDRVLPRDGPRLRLLLAVPRPDRATRGGAGIAAQRRQRSEGCGETGTPGGIARRRGRARPLAGGPRPLSAEVSADGIASIPGTV